VDGGGGEGVGPDGLREKQDSAKLSACTGV
jgi:hypothetical protein